MNPSRCAWENGRDGLGVCRPVGSLEHTDAARDLLDDGRVIVPHGNQHHQHDEHRGTRDDLRRSKHTALEMQLLQGMLSSQRTW